MNSEQFKELLYNALAGDTIALKEWYELISTKLVNSQNIKCALVPIESILLQPQHPQFANALYMRASMHEYGQGGVLDVFAASDLYEQAQALRHPLAFEINLDDLEDCHDFLTEVKKNKGIKNIYDAIHEIGRCGTLLAEEDIPKGKILKQHEQRLKSELDFFLLKCSRNQYTPQRIMQFKNYFNQLVHEKDELMNTHRTIWKPIVMNIAIAISGVGFIALLIKIASNWYDDAPMTFNSNCFFAETNSQRLNNTLDLCVKTSSVDDFTIQVAGISTNDFVMK